MNKNDNKQPLKKLCFRIGDGLHGTPEYSDDTDFYFVNGNNLQNGKIELTNNTKTVSKEEFINNFISLNNNTLLLSINGTLGNMAFFNNEKIILGKSAAYLNFKTNINSFYYYYFQLKEVQEYFYNVATGSTIKNLSLKSIQDFEVPYPKEKEWKPIAKVLSDLDAKIELNNKINQELEAMAKTLYDYWFVQFDFPNEQGKPYKSSGGKMLYNEELKREIPEGWEVGSFGDYSTVKSGFAFKSTWWQTTGIPVIKIKDIQEDYTLNINDFSFVGSDKVKVAKHFKTKAGDVIIAMTGATIGKFAMIPYSDNIMLVNQRVGLYDLGEEPFFKLPYLLNSMKQDFFRSKVFQIAGGAAQPNISGEQLDSFPLLKTNDELIDLYNNKLKSTYKRIASNIKQNQQLTELRDWLLPMLMNGQVTVKEVEEQIAIAAEPKVKYNKTIKVDFQAKQCSKHQRAILAAYIIQYTGNKEFGRTKLMKLLHLTEYHCRIDLDSHFIKNVAGPYDENMIKDIELYFRRFHLYDIQKEKFNKNHSKISYTQIAPTEEINRLFSDNFNSEVLRINHLLKEMETWSYEECEILSTLYAVWNNRIILNQEITDKLLKQDFVDWHKQKAKYKDRLDGALKWIRDKGIIPTGWGDYIDSRQSV